MAREEGLSKITLFPLTKDEAGGEPTWGEPISVPWAQNIETEDEYREGIYYGDNIVEQARKSLSKIGVEMEVSSDISPKLDSQITGKGYTGGMAHKTLGQQAPSYALAYEILMSDGNLRRRIIYNIGFTRDAHTNKTIEEEGEGQTYTYSGVGLPLASTGDVEGIMDLKEINKVVDEGEKAFLKQRWESFFTAPVLPKAYSPLEL